jgi:hypothetical protein
MNTLLRTTPISTGARDADPDLRDADSWDLRDADLSDLRLASALDEVCQRSPEVSAAAGEAEYDVVLKAHEAVQLGFENPFLIAVAAETLGTVL